MQRNPQRSALLDYSRCDGILTTIEGWRTDCCARNTNRQRARGGNRTGPMPDGVLDGVRGFVERLRESPTKQPHWLEFSGDEEDLRRGEDYFQVRVNRIYLSRERQWFSRYAPVVLAAAEFSYGAQSAVVPSVVGPALVEKLGGPVPAGTVVAGTRVAGPYPFAGDLAISVVLYRVEQEKILEPLLEAIQGAAGALDLATGLAPYAKIARVVLTGVESLAGGDKPLMGRRDDLAKVRPGSFALVDPDAEIDEGSLGIKNGELVWAEDGRGFRDADYILYSVERVPADEVNVMRLPLYALWDSVVQDATRSASDDAWQSTKVKMSALVALLYSSPDLVWSHAEQLHDEWEAAMVRLHEKAVRLSTLAPSSGAQAEARNRALAVLRA
jgi:hypothetical protein